MDKDIDIYLFRHVNFEHCPSGRMFGWNGYIHDDCCEYISNIVKSLCGKELNIIRNRQETGLINDMSLFSDVDPFFKNYNICLNIEYDNTIDFRKQPDTLCLYNYESDFLNPEFDLYIDGLSKGMLHGKIFKSIGHGFINAYNDFETFNDRGERFADNFINDKQNVIEVSDVKSFIKNFLYIGNIENHDKLISEDMYDVFKNEIPFYKSDEITKSIMRSDEYKKVIEYSKKLCWIKYRSENDVKNDIVYLVNKQTDNNFISFEKAFEHLKIKMVNILNSFYELSAEKAFNNYIEITKHWI